MEGSVSRAKYRVVCHTVVCSGQIVRTIDVESNVDACLRYAVRNTAAAKNCKPKIVFEVPDVSLKPVPV